MLDWPHAHALSRPTALFRDTPADFQVVEELGFPLTGEGEHLWVLVEKTGLNTVDVARRLGRATGCHPRDIGYAGLKDRQAVTRQWFSLKTSGSLADKDIDTASIRIIEQARNARKLRHGSHRGNRFVITLKDVTLTDVDRDEVVALLGLQGVPNYFGSQRFGHGGANVVRARELFSGKLSRVPRFQRSMFLSAARSYLFNRVLAERVTDGTWNSLVSGDVMALAGSGSVFKADPGDTALADRLETGDIHPTGPLWGAGELLTTDRVRELEWQVAGDNEDLAEGLASAGLKQERRALRVLPEKLSLTPAGAGQLVIEFSLPKGAYATSVLREIVSAPGL